MAAPTTSLATRTDAHAHAQWDTRRAQLEHYFDRTAAADWARLTSDAPVSRIRQTVRAGRARMRETILGYLPADLRGARLLDAGCGTGALAVEAAQRGAEVVAIDVSPTLIGLARERLPRSLGAGTIDFVVADMRERALGSFDWVVAMDSLIHYRTDDIVRAVGDLYARARVGVVFTYAPKTPLLTMMHWAGRLFPRADRAPDIVPVAESLLRRRLGAVLDGATLGRSERINASFYTSCTFEVLR